MRSFLFAYFALLCRTVLSLPIEQEILSTLSQDPEQAAPCDAVDGYTSDWFLSNTLDEYRQEIHGKALFYTKGASKYARQLACGSKEYVSLWQIWPKYLYNDNLTPDNPLRCIHKDHKKRQKFYENMSEAFARLAREHATVMHLSADYNSPPLDGIWGRVELPTLRGQTDITEMVKTTENRISAKWTLLDKEPKGIIDAAIGEVQRILRSAKSVKYPSLWGSEIDGDACTLWASNENGYLDSLW